MEGVIVDSNINKSKSVLINLPINAERSTVLASVILEKYLVQMRYDVKIISENSFAIKSDGDIKINLGLKFIKDKKIISRLKDDGSFYIKTGPNEIFLGGHDMDFFTSGPVNFIKSDKDSILRIWDKQTNNHWDNPFIALNSFYNVNFKSCALDKRGTINAVFYFLEILGWRFYMPGDLGVIKGTETISTLKDDTIVAPKVSFRNFIFYGKRYNQLSEDDLFYLLSLKLNPYSELSDPLMLGHGMRMIHNRDEKKLDLDLFGSYSGRRDNSSRNFGKPCLSSKKLFKEHVSYLDHLFKMYDIESVSVMPTDSYANICECDNCKSLNSPKRGFKGEMSNYVWNYINNLAIEIGKLYPSKKITCFAYGSYLLPPENIKKFNKNLIIGVCRNRYFESNSDQESTQPILNDWVLKTDNPIVFWDYYTHNSQGTKTEYFPIIFSNEIQKDLLRNLDHMDGEAIEVYRDNSDADFAFNHYNVYLTSRLYWNPTLDIQQLRDEYLNLMFSPVFKEMRELFILLESLTLKDFTNTNIIKQIQTLFRSAQSKTNQGSIVYDRLVKMENHISPMFTLLQELKRPDNNVRLRPTRVDASSQIIDGKLDELFWSNLVEYSIKEGGNKPNPESAFKFIWTGDNTLCFGIKAFNMKREDDLIEILLENSDQNFIKILLNFKGVKSVLYNNKFVENERVLNSVSCKDGACIFEIKIPFYREGIGKFIGKRPNDNFPWFFNISKTEKLGNNYFFYNQNQSDYENMIKIATKD